MSAPYTATANTTTAAQRTTAMTAITIDTRHLKAAAILASEDPRKPYICGVHMEHTLEHGTLLVATDGAVLLALRTAPPPAADAQDAPPPARVLIPAHVIKQIKPHKRYTAAALEHVGDGMWHLTHGDQILTWRADPTEYPVWRRVLPKHTTAGKPAYYDPALVARMAKAGALIGDAFPVIIPHGDDPAWVAYTAAEVDVFGVIMPRRHPPALDPKMTAPAWAAA
jgi:hypothetical protein